MLSEKDFINLARYIDQREALLVDRVESQIRQVENQQTQLARKVEKIAHGTAGSKSRREARR